MKAKPKPSRFDSLFEDAKFAQEVLEQRILGPAQNIARQDIERLGLHFARLLMHGHPQDLRDIADALSQWREANRPADRLQAIDEILLALPKLFPMRPKRPDKLVRYRTREIAVRDVLENLKLSGFAPCESDRKQIQRRAAVLGIPLDDTAGRPKPPQKNCDKRR